MILVREARCLRRGLRKDQTGSDSDGQTIRHNALRSHWVFMFYSQLRGWAGLLCSRGFDHKAPCLDPCKINGQSPADPLIVRLSRSGCLPPAQAVQLDLNL